MWTRPEKPLALHPSQLQIGIFVWLDLSWDEHPFFYNKFRIGSAEEIEKIKSLNLAEVFYFPNKSTSQPLPLARKTASKQTNMASPKSEPDARTTAEIAAAKAKDDLRQQQKIAAARADRAWEKAAKQTREALLGLSRAPKQAGESLAELSRSTASLISNSTEVLLHLLGDKGGEGPQFHALNVMTLSMILGKASGLNEDELADLAMGSLAHDCGKARVPQHILYAKSRQKHEEDFYRAHCDYGAEFAAESGAFSAEAISVVRNHHKFLDNSGFPAGKADGSPLTAIVALVNRYDRLCGPEAPEKTAALMPTEALATIYAKDKGKFDAKLVGLLVRILGVYPPGTVVQLNDGALGLVVSPGIESLRPKVLIYDPELSKNDAPVVDLMSAPGIKIEESIRPSTLPADVVAWLNPRQRLSYFFSVESVKSK